MTTQPETADPIETVENILNNGGTPTDEQVEAAVEEAIVESLIGGEGLEGDADLEAAFDDENGDDDA